MSEKGFLDYVPLQFLNFDAVAIILIVGLVASIIAFYCFAAEVKIKKDEEMKIKKPKITRKRKAKTKEKLFIEEDDFATEEVLELDVEESNTEETLTLENNGVQENIDFKNINLEDLDLKGIELTGIEENLLKEEKPSDVVDVNLSDEDELFLAELMKTLDNDKKDLGKNQSKVNNDNEITVSNDNQKAEDEFIATESILQNKEEEKGEVENEENNFELSIKEKMKIYAENLKKDENISKEDENNSEN